MASGSGWNLWVWLLGVVVRRYIFPHTTYPYFSCICSFCCIYTFCSFKKCFLHNIIYVYTKVCVSNSQVTEAALKHIDMLHIINNYK